MAIVCIEGHRFDTSKAKARWELDHWDGNNRHTGDLFLSSKGTWYVNTPSQWPNGHRWEIIDPAEAVERYRRYLDDDDIVEILKLASLDTE